MNDIPPGRSRVSLDRRTLTALAIGVAVGSLVAAVHPLARAADPARVVVTADEVRRARSALRESFGREPSYEELRRAVDDGARAEVLARVAGESGTVADAATLAEIASARLELVATAEASRRPATDAEVEAYVSLRPERYAMLDPAAAREVARRDLEAERVDEVREALHHTAANRVRIEYDRAARAALAAP